MKHQLRFMARASTVALVIAAAIMFNVAHAGEKVTICHVPPGNPGNAHTITVNANAWRAHQAHGDSMGECPGTSPGSPGHGGNTFVLVVCDSRKGETGRQIQVSGSGRAMVTDTECH